MNWTEIEKNQNKKALILNYQLTERDKTNPVCLVQPGRLSTIKLSTIN